MTLTGQNDRAKGIWFGSGFSDRSIPDQDQDPAPSGSGSPIPAWHPSTGTRANKAHCRLPHLHWQNPSLAMGNCSLP